MKLNKYLAMTAVAMLATACTDRTDRAQDTNDTDATYGTTSTTTTTAPAIGSGTAPAVGSGTTSPGATPMDETRPHSGTGSSTMDSHPNNTSPGTGR